MKIAIIISSLRSGGAERVASIASSHWARAGRQVAVITLSGGEEAPFHKLDPRVQHLPLGVAGPAQNHLSGIIGNLRRLWIIRREIVKFGPDVVISFMDTTNVLAVISTRGLGIPVVVSERTNPARDDLKPAWRSLRNLVYGHAEAVVAQTERARACLPERVQRRCAVIPNPVLPAPDLKVREEVVVPRRSLATMGRLSSEKGFDLLIDAFAALAPMHPGWHLLIMGEGPRRASLETQIAHLGLGHRGFLLGPLKHPAQVLMRSDIFVLTSRYEGFPNALCEAMACGLPPVSFDCPFGPAEIIRHGVDGLLVPPGNSTALVEALDRLMRDEDERRRLAARAPEVVERFALDKVMGMWEEILQRVVK